ncbi:MAG TPA: S4 domain-containing protein [Steroidobacteraceae bacterium]|nr:S4 domain-containing protein [Steroidobacteraceae bacterium]
MRPRARARSSAGSTPERVQKLLAAAGVGSRREVERWIREGRLRINGEVAAIGARLAPRDRITLDGHPLRLPSSKAGQLLLYHRSPGAALDWKAATRPAAARAAAGRWLAIQPLPPVDGGLEILTNDGSLAQRISRGVHALEVDYVLRMRGRLNDTLVAEFLQASECDGAPMSILSAVPKYGAGLNHWLDVSARATRSAQVRHWWAARGMIVARLMRVRLGPIRLSRELPRGRSRAMSSDERDALLREVDTAAAGGERRARPAAGS